MSKALFLGYDRSETGLIHLIESRGFEVEQTQEQIFDLSSYNVVISYGYRRILKADVLVTSKRPIVNLHISLLPYNRGAHPLFWAAYDGTPVGVSIHEIDAGIDTGPIIQQKIVEVDLARSSFSTGYSKLRSEVERLFEEHADTILLGLYKARPQTSQGTYHSFKDLPSGFSWDEKIGLAIKRLKNS